MTVLYYYFFIAKDRLKSIRENILYSKSLRKVLGNIVLCFISLIAIPISCSRFLISRQLDFNVVNKFWIN